MPAKFYTSVNTFNGGEISELLFNREDITKYKSSCRVLENAFPLVEGGAKKMPGSYFAGRTQNSLAPARLAPFQFSTDQGAILEFTPNIIRIWSPSAPGEWNLGLVESGGFPIQLVTPYTQADLFQLDCATQSADVLWIFHPSYPPACVERHGPSNWTYNLAPPGGPPVGPGDPAYYGTSDVINTGYAGIGVAILQMTQAFPLVMVTDSAFALGDRIYINECAGMVELNQGQFFTIPVLNNGDAAAFTGHIDDTAGTPGAGLILTVSAVSSGTILVGMQITGPNVAPNTTITAYLSGTGGTGTYQVNIQQKVVSVDLSGIGGFCYNLIPVPVVGQHSGIIFTGSISGTVLTITAVAAGVILGTPGIYFPGVVGGTAITSFGTGTGGVGTYNINNSQTAGSQQMSTVPVVSTAYLPYEGGGFAVKVIPFFDAAGDYPSCGTFYQGRLCVGGTNNHPTQLNGSVIEDFPDFICDPNQDDSGINFTLQSTLLDQIVSILGTPNALLLGTAGGAWVMTGASGSALSQSNVNASKQTSIGVNPLQPQLVGDSAIFVSRSARQVMFITYDFGTNEWNNFDLTRLNRQITIGPNETLSGIVQTGFQSEPYPIFWAVRGDGQLIGMVFNKQDQVFGWFRVNMLPENGFIESVAVISGQNQEDMVVVEVNRGTINGETARYVEYFYPQELFNDLGNAFFVHCGLQLNLGPAIGITGITNANPCVVTAPGHNFANGSFVQIAGVIGTPPNPPTPGSGMWQVNQGKTEAYTVSNTNPPEGTFELQGVDSTMWGPYLGGGTALPVTNTVTGMNYLLGKEVVAVGDLALILPPTVVTGDSITFLYYCAKITIGLPYKMIVQPTNPVITAQTFSTRGQKQKLSRVTISLYQSIGGKYGIQDVPEHMYDIKYEAEGEQQ